MGKRRCTGMLNQEYVENQSREEKKKIDRTQFKKQQRQKILTL